jgi:hypothetical protein
MFSQFQKHVSLLALALGAAGGSLALTACGGGGSSGAILPIPTDPCAGLIEDGILVDIDGDPLTVKGVLVTNGSTPTGFLGDAGSNVFTSDTGFRFNADFYELDASAGALVGIVQASVDFDTFLKVLEITPAREIFIIVSNDDFSAETLTNSGLSFTVEPDTCYVVSAESYWSFDQTQNPSSGTYQLGAISLTSPTPTPAPVTDVDKDNDGEDDDREGGGGSEGGGI